jgi:hypothetical protein
MVEGMDNDRFPENDFRKRPKQRRWRTAVESGWENDFSTRINPFEASVNP